MPRREKAREEMASSQLAARGLAEPANRTLILGAEPLRHTYGVHTMQRFSRTVHRIAKTHAGAG